MINQNRSPQSVWTGLFAGLVFLVFAPPSFAGITSNPDVLRIRRGFEATTGTELDANEVVFRAGQGALFRQGGYFSGRMTPGTYVKGFASNYDAESGFSVRLTWFAFDPDSVKRSRDSVSIRQKSNLGIGVVLQGNNSTISDRQEIVEGCSAKAKLRIGAKAKASASLKCSKSVWENLGFNAGQIEAIESALGTTKIKFGYKGE